MRNLKRKDLLSESLFPLKNKLMYGVNKAMTDQVTKLNITKNLVEKISELLDAEVHYSYMLDHKGEEKRKISIVYKEEK
jgi:hypothetical protein